jgi:hypothetical protein
MAVRCKLRIRYGRSLPAHQSTKGAYRKAQEVGADLATRAATHITACEQENIHLHSLFCLDFPEGITGNPSNPAPGDCRSCNTTQRDDQSPALGSYLVSVNRPGPGADFDTTSLKAAAPRFSCICSHNQAACLRPSAGAVLSPGGASKPSDHQQYSFA